MISLAFLFSSKISRWRLEDIPPSLRNLSSDLAAVLESWSENCCLCSCLLVAWMIRLDVFFPVYSEDQKERKKEKKRERKAGVFASVMLLICEFGGGS